MEMTGDDLVDDEIVPLALTDSAEKVASAESMEVDVVLIRDIPKLKYHEKPLRFISQPGISQEAYERNVLGSRRCDVTTHKVDPAEDANEQVTMTCPDLPDGTPHTFSILTSVLSRSPTFKRFFNSEHYLPGCDMQLKLTLDPAACVKIAMWYLWSGADVFDQRCIDSEIDAYINRVDRLHVLGRLYLLATNLGLPVLANMAFEGLLQRERPMPAGYVLSLASLVFSPQIGFDERMRKWCMKHVETRVQGLIIMAEWWELLPTLDKEFRDEWDFMVKLANHRYAWSSLGHEARAPSESDTDEELIKELVRETSRPGFNMHHPFKDVAKHRSLNSDVDWEKRKSEIIGQYDGGQEEHTRLEPFKPQRTRSRKAVGWLQLSPHTDKGGDKAQEQDMSWADEYVECTSPEVAKAVVVLGMNDVGGKVTALSRPSSVSRILFKISHH